MQVAPQIQDLDLYDRRPLRVMHVMAGAEQGGAENIFLESVLALAETRIEQFVITRPNNSFRLEQFQIAGIETRTADFSNWFRWPTQKVISDTVATFDPDIIEYWMGRAGTYALKHRGRNIGWYGGYYKLKRFRNCSHHIGLTRDLVRHINQQGVEDSRIGLVHTYAEFKEVEPASRAPLATPDEAPLLLALARLHPKKAIDILLNAVAGLPGVYLWIAGEGPIEGDLKALCKSLDLEDRVRFLGWRNDRGALLAAADICVFPSRYEPFGTVTVDAWAAGVTLIAAKAAGPKAYVTHEHDGLLVEIDDVEGLREAIRTVIADEDLRKRLIAGGHTTYEKQFTKEVFIKDSLTFYQKALADQV